MKQLKLDEFLSYKFLSQVKWAPGGGQAAFVVSSANKNGAKYDSNIWLYKDGKTRRLTGSNGESKFFWEDETHIIFSAVRSEEDKKYAENQGEYTSYYRIDTEGGEAVFAYRLPIKAGDLYPLGGGKYATVSTIDAKMPDFYKLSKKERDATERDSSYKDYVAIEMAPWWRNGGSFFSGTAKALFICDTKTGKAERITGPEIEVNRIMLQGGNIYFTAFDETRPIEDRRPGIWKVEDDLKTLTQLLAPNTYYIHKVEAWHKGLLCRKSVEMDVTGDFLNFDLETLEFTRVAPWLHNTNSSVGSDCRLGGGTMMKEYNEEVYFVSTVRNASNIVKITKNGEVVSVTEGEGSVDCFDISDKGEILAVAMKDMRLQELYLIKDGKFIKKTSFNDKILRGKYVAKPEKFTIKPDKYEIDGWILKPMDYDPEKTYPAILDIHGGPRTAYGEVFFHEMQYWAGEGYFVIFCNPVGSDGRGDDFATVILENFGDRDFKDIMAITDKALEMYPQIDKSRIGVTGGSYGGFMTNWIIGHTDRFACAATQRSICNWVTMESISDIGEFFVQRNIGGGLVNDVEKLWDQSPLKYAANFKTPTLIIHADADYRCPIAEGYQMLYALKSRGVDSRMVIFKGENHELSRSGQPKHRVRRLTEITNWMNKYTK